MSATVCVYVSVRMCTVVHACSACLCLCVCMHVSLCVCVCVTNAFHLYLGSFGKVFDKKSYISVILRYLHCTFIVFLLSV